MKNLFLPVLIALSSIGTLNAQDAGSEPTPRFEMGWNPVSYLRLGSDNTRGASVSVAMKKTERIGYALDLSIHQTRTANPLTTANYRFGPRFYAPSRGNWTPFGEVLLGGGYVSGKTVTTGTTSKTLPGHNGFSFAAGFGLDVKFKPWFSLRVIQADYSLLRAGRTLDGFRLHAGGVFHFGPSQ